MFAHRIEGSIGTVKSWEEDEELFHVCRSQLPWDDLRNERGPYSDSEKDRHLSRTARFVQRLARYFKESMTWVNQPPCVACQGTDMQIVGNRGPETFEERQGKASRVEVYRCLNCHATTEFPRYNSVKTLLETKKGRCGEYANLFGFVCRAVGLETRYILDFTDHVWTEVRIGDEWMMVDSCEGVVDEPSMYEAGWGKQLSYVIAIANDHCLDVTPRYSRKLNSDDMIARRRQFSFSDAESDGVIQHLCARLCSSMNQKGQGELLKRLSLEQKNLLEFKRKTEWEKHYNKGRISGSLDWKLSRSEAGSKDANIQTEAGGAPSGLYMESFYSLTTEITIFVNPTPTTAHGAIVVSGTECAVGYPSSISVVILDEIYLGCILQSRCFVNFGDFSRFLTTLPVGRIIVIHGTLTKTSDGPDTISEVPQLPTLDPLLFEKGIVFAGQIGCSPSWSFSKAYVDVPKGVCLKVPGRCASHKELKLQESKDTCSSYISGRIPEQIMPLKTQLVATLAQKQTAFEAYMETQEEGTCCGFTTRNGMPIYLLGNLAYPFQRCSAALDSWSCHYFLPPSLATVNQDLSSEKSINANYEVPVDMPFFTTKLGYQLLKKQDGVQVQLPTTTALRNSRLVALYFSAHWCGPCRSFTPMLAEMYEYLQDLYPTHGIEIVFISSDRDQASFDGYYRSMPWCSVPFEALGSYKQLLSMQYGIRGIPSLVVLDAITGQTIVSVAQSRSDVLEACSRGEQGIENLYRKWLNMVPVETKELLTMLEVSCADAVASSSQQSALENPYFVRSEHTASLTAYEPIAMESIDDIEDIEFRNPSVDDCIHYVLERPSGNGCLEQVISTALKYVENAQRQPWNPKYRAFKLHNKVADKITQVEGGIALLRALDFEIASTVADFVARIPLENDLTQMYDRIDAIKKQYC